jgi:hypothetical protein
MRYEFYYLGKSLEEQQKQNLGTYSSYLDIYIMIKNTKIKQAI